MAQCSGMRSWDGKLRLDIALIRFSRYLMFAMWVVRRCRRDSSQCHMMSSWDGCPHCIRATGRGASALSESVNRLWQASLLLTLRSTLGLPSTFRSLEQHPVSSLPEVDGPEPVDDVDAVWAELEEERRQLEETDVSILENVKVSVLGGREDGKGSA